MRRYIILLLCLGTLALSVGCSQQQEESGGVQLYFTAATTEYYGEAIIGEEYTGDTSEGVDIITLMTALLEGPTSSTLTNPFPVGTEVLWAGWRTDGVLVVNLTEEYSGLMGIDLTLADYCIVKTLCQIEGVEQVLILAAGQEIAYRDHQVLSLEDVI